MGLGRKGRGLITVNAPNWTHVHVKVMAPRRRQVEYSRLFGKVMAPYKSKPVYKFVCKSIGTLQKQSSIEVCVKVLAPFKSRSLCVKVMATKASQYKSRLCIKVMAPYKSKSALELCMCKCNVNLQKRGSIQVCVLKKIRAPVKSESV